MNQHKIVKIFACIALSTGSFLLLIGLKIVFERYQKANLFPIDGLHVPTAAIPTHPTLSKKIVYGFLPYWTIKTAQVPPQLSHLGYFSVTVDKTGNFVTTFEGNREPGWRIFTSSDFQDLREHTNMQKQHLEVVITMMDADDITSFLQNPRAQETCLANLKILIKTQPIEGINLDIEYAGEVTESLREKYIAFVQRVATMTKQLDPDFHLSIDVFADSAAKRRIWDISSLAPLVDRIIIMAYDFSRSSSPQSGPVAPLFGSTTKRWDTDITQNLKAFLDVVPAEKIILGIPFYGYEWQTISEDPGALTYPKTGGLATYKRVRKLIADLGIQERWDTDALSPYLTYKDGYKTQMIYYENSRSLSYKLDLVNQAGLGGIAIWALGYEGETQELWDVIRDKISSSSTLGQGKSL